MQLQISRTGKLLVTTAFSAIIIALVAIFAPSTALAEGSADITNDGGRRAYAYSTNIIKAYVQSGETLNLGSSDYNYDGDINFTKPSGVEDSCDAINSRNNTTGGHIANRSEEVAGPLPNAGGFEPCVVNVDETGVWEISFESSGWGSPLVRDADAEWGTSGSFVTAWDVTVRDASGTDIDGRVYSNKLRFDVGAHAEPVDFDLFFLVNGGYIYNYDLNGMYPHVFTVFANNKGLVDSNGTPIYHSASEYSRTYTYHDPDSPDTTGAYPDITHKIFFNTPSSDLPERAAINGGETWMMESYGVPQASNINFVGEDGTPNQAGTANKGGFVTFDSTAPATYSIIIDVNQDGIYGNANDRFLFGQARTGSNQAYWNGIDGDGNAIPVGTYDYDVQVTLNSGEAHFLMADVEGNPNGMIVLAEDGTSTIFYDDRPIGGDAALNGVNSSPNGAHAWDSSHTDLGIGDTNIVDTWTYLPSDVTTSSITVTFVEAEISISTTEMNCNDYATDVVNYDVTVRNIGPNADNNLLFADSAVDQFESISWTCEIVNGVGSCSMSAGTKADLNNLVLALDPDAEARISIEGTNPTISSSMFSHSVSINSQTADINDPVLANNYASLSQNLFCGTDPDDVVPELPETGDSLFLAQGLALAAAFALPATVVYGKVKKSRLEVK